MSQTDENLVRPSKLNPQAPQNSTNHFDLTELQTLVSQMVKQQTQQIFDRLGQGTSRSSNDIDQKIDIKYLDNLNDMERIPDVVKSLREFSGQPGEFSSWKKSVDRILKLYESMKGTPKYFGMLSVIRNKITGQADTALESYNTPLNWERISKCLTLHYADKRDLGTLEYQLTTLVQRQQSVPEFYQQVYQHLSLILNKLSSMEMGQEAMDSMTQSYRDKALDTFVRGLKGDLPRLLSIRGPIDLPEALHLCLKLENVQYRIHHSHGTTNTRVPQLIHPPIIHPPPIQPRKIIPTQSYPAYNSQMRGFYPELLHRPQALQLNYNQPSPNYFPKPPMFRHQIPPNPFNNNYPPKPPQPMEVDASIQSRHVNYQNRPNLNQFANKRIHSNQIHQPAKMQRVYYAEQQNEYPDVALYQDQMNEYDEQNGQTLIEYTNSIDNPPLIEEVENQNENNEQVEQLDDIHFLD